MGPKAVITGDIVNSGKLNKNDWNQLLVLLKKSFSNIEELILKGTGNFEIYRGDSFQAILLDPSKALLVALLIRANIRSYIPSFQKERQLQQSYNDARISIGIGQIEMRTENITESKGEAFLLSGRFLDTMKKHDLRLGIKTTDENINEELNLACLLSDAIIKYWNTNHAEVIYPYLLYGMTQNDLAKRFSISQPAIHKRLIVYGNIDKIEVFLERYIKLIARLSNGNP